MTILTLLDKVAVDTVGDWFPWNGGAADIIVTADNFGSGTVTLERSSDQLVALPVNFIDETLFAVTANSTFPANGWSHGTFIRATLSGSTNAVNVKVTV